MLSVAEATVRAPATAHDDYMETNRTARINNADSNAPRSSQAMRAITTAICAALFVVVLAFGAPSADSGRWDIDVDAHSDVALDIAVGLGD